MIILDTHYAEVTFDESRQLGMIRWKGKATSDEYQNAFTTLLNLQKTKTITRYISDIRQQTVISPADRKWFETVAFPAAVAGGLKAAAVVFDGNAFKKYYINVILSTTNKFKLPMKVLSNLEEAEEWIMKM